MLERQKTPTSKYDTRLVEERKKKKKEISRKKSSIGIGIGISLSFVTLILQCVAFFTPHWKEITPNTNSLYVEGVDALIRTEVLHYFDTIHRYTRHSYGLFQRC